MNSRNIIRHSFNRLTCIRGATEPRLYVYVLGRKLSFLLRNTKKGMLAQHKGVTKAHSLLLSSSIRSSIWWHSVFQVGSKRTETG